MSHARQAWTVARWEFRRYFKWRDQVIGFALFLVIGAASIGASVVAGAKGSTKTIALAGLELTAPSTSRLRFVAANADEKLRLRDLERGDVDGVLARRADGSFELSVVKDPRYRNELTELLGHVMRRERLAATGIAAAELERVLAPVPLELRFTDPSVERRGTPEKIAAGVCIAILLMAVFTSVAYILTGITGEKQLRVTESVLSAIRPQAWIDGKLLGITAYSLTGMLNMLIGPAIVAACAHVFTDFTLPAAAIRPGVVLVLGIYTVLGLLLWNAFIAAVASTIDDPNASSRSALIMLPFLPAVMSIALVRDADSWLARALALCPLTSAPAMPVRLVLSDPGFFEIGTSLVLLCAAIWIARRVAGRIFEVGMLMYGKEPSWREIARWAFERR